MKQDSTDALEHVLESTEPADINNYLAAFADNLVQDEHPFASYMRTILKQKGISQQQLFIRAELSDRYGYRLLSQEKHTRNRDYILRLCFAGEFSLKETQRALKLYGMSELYAKVPRDAVLIIAFNHKIYTIDQVNKLLTEHGLEPLKDSSVPE